MITSQVMAVFSSNGNFPLSGQSMIIEPVSPPIVRAVHRGTFLFLRSGGYFLIAYTFLQQAQMIVTPGTITMIIAATRMHRSLVDLASGPPGEVYVRHVRLSLSLVILLTGAGNVIFLVRSRLSNWVVSPRYRRSSRHRPMPQHRRLSSNNNMAIRRIC